MVARFIGLRKIGGGRLVGMAKFLSRSFTGMRVTHPSPTCSKRRGRLYGSKSLHERDQRPNPVATKRNDERFRYQIDERLRAAEALMRPLSFRSTSQTQLWREMHLRCTVFQCVYFTGLAWDLRGARFSDGSRSRSDSSGPSNLVGRLAPVPALLRVPYGVFPPQYHSQ